MLRLLADRFERTKSRLDGAFQNVEKLKKEMERDGIQTLGSRTSPEPPAVISDMGLGLGYSAHSAGSSSPSHDSNAGEESS